MTEQRSSEMRVPQRCEENRDARSSEMRREQRCEEKRDREIQREQRERGERGATPPGVKLCFPEGIRCQAVLESFLERRSRSDSAPGVDV